MGPPSPFFLDLWQGKELQEGPLYVWQAKGLRAWFWSIFFACVDVWQGKDLDSARPMDGCMAIDPATGKEAAGGTAGAGVEAQMEG
jgi:hypothetical protein